MTARSLVEDTGLVIVSEPDVARSRGRRRRVEIVLSVLPPVIFLLIWEDLARLGLVNALFFPRPTLILDSIYVLTQRGELPHQVAVSLQRVFLGFALGAVPGVLLGVAMGWSRRVRAALEPLIAASYPIPKLAILPLIMLIFGVGEASKIAIIAVGAFFPAAINAAAGVTGISAVFFEAARNFGAGRLRTFAYVVLPGSLPMVFAGLRLAFGIALLLVVAAEFVAAREGVGAMIWLAWQTLRIERLYAGIVTWAVVGMISNRLLRALERRVIPWSD